MPLLASRKYVDTEDKFTCRRGYNYGGKKPMGCHHHRSPVNHELGIYESCNAYFANVYDELLINLTSPAEGHGCME